MPGGTEVVEHEIRVEAPPEAVFDYFTDPAKLVRWMGDEATLDPRPGGVCRLAIGVVTMVGEYVEVTPPRRLVLRWGFQGAVAGVPPVSTEVEVNFEAQDGGTRVRLTHRRLPAEGVEFHTVGWTHFMRRLGVAGAGADPGPDEWLVQAQRQMRLGEGRE
jgi:uncharacterized protein YndB with AHSA1/START domain